MISQMFTTQTRKTFNPTLANQQADDSVHGQTRSFINQDCVEIPDLIDRLLQLSRLQAGTLDIALEPCQINDIFHACVEQLEALAPDHRLCIDIAPDVMPVMASMCRVGEVLVSLVENAVKFSPEGSTIWITAYRQNSFVQINVADQGMGIAPESRNAVFEAYLQPEYQMSAGAGLGLAIARSMIESQGGEMWIADRSRKGFHTTISFTLPVVTAANWNQTARKTRRTGYTSESLLAEPYLMPV